MRIVSRSFRGLCMDSILPTFYSFEQAFQLSQLTKHLLESISLSNLIFYSIFTFYIFVKTFKFYGAMQKICFVGLMIIDNNICFCIDQKYGDRFYNHRC